MQSDGQREEMNFKPAQQAWWQDGKAWFVRDGKPVPVNPTPHPKQCVNCTAWQPINGTAPWWTPAGRCLRQPLQYDAAHDRYIAADAITDGVHYVVTGPDDGCRLWEGA